MSIGNQTYMRIESHLMITSNLIEEPPVSSWGKSTVICQAKRSYKYKITELKFTLLKTIISIEIGRTY